MKKQDKKNFEKEPVSNPLELGEAIEDLSGSDRRIYDRLWRTEHKQKYIKIKDLAKTLDIPGFVVKRSLDKLIQRGLVDESKIGGGALVYKTYEFQNNITRPKEVR